MADKIRVKRGNKANLPTLDDGEFGLSEDTKELFLGTTSGNKKMGVESPWGDTTRDLRSSVLAYPSGTQSLLAATWTLLSLDTKSYDHKFEFASSTYTAAANETVILTGSVTFSSVTAGNTTIARLYVNGGPDRALAEYKAGATGSVTLNFCVQVELSAGQTIQIYVYAGNATSITSGIVNTHVEITRIA